MTDKERIKEIMSTDSLLKQHVNDLLELSLKIQEINLNPNFTLQERVQKLNWNRVVFWRLFDTVFELEIKPMGITSEYFLFQLINHNWRFCIPFPRVAKAHYLREQ